MSHPIAAVLRRVVVVAALVGAGLIVPVAASADPAPPSGTTTYVVQLDDQSIASRFGITLEALLAANGFNASTVVHPGDVIRIPVPPPPPPPAPPTTTAPPAPPAPTPPAAPAPPPPPPVDPLAIPANSGSGKRLIMSLSQQRAWAVEANGSLTRTWLVSGRKTMPGTGTYKVFSRSMYTVALANRTIKFRYMVRFAKGPKGDNIGFHEIPTKFGVPVQTLAQLGQPLSGGCVRQSTADAQFVWNWAPISTKVVVVP